MTDVETVRLHMTTVGEDRVFPVPVPVFASVLRIRESGSGTLNPASCDSCMIVISTHNTLTRSGAKHPHQHPRRLRNYLSFIPLGCQLFYCDRLHVTVSGDSVIHLTS